jgi:YfiH family protein
MSVDVHRAVALDGIAHGFCGRRGGVSSGAVASLNCGLGSGDDRALVLENRRRAATAIAPGAILVGVHQVHSATCITLTQPWDHDRRPHADAMVTNRPGVLLSVVTADCAPVLLADRVAGVIGVAHAGWRGALDGVIQATVSAMIDLGARHADIEGAIGPCIHQSSYEVDDAFRERFVAVSPDFDRFFAAGSGSRPHFDLPGFVRAQVAAAGVGACEVLQFDTYADAESFYSYRRSTHRGEADYGRQLSAIALGD